VNSLLDDRFGKMGADFAGFAEAGSELFAEGHEFFDFFDNATLLLKWRHRY